ncbi:MAG: DUF998 domain-containing protein [Candidatus Kariarchaeaceae archaeon]|jgi:hypothetical protein
MRLYHHYLGGVYIWIVLVVQTIVFTLLHPGYNHLRQPFSELGALDAPNYILFNLLVFIALGIWSLYFIQDILQFFDHKSMRVPAWIHRMAAFSWIFTGAFPLSYDIQWLYTTHLVGAVLTYIFGGLTIVLYIRHFNYHRSDFTFFSIVSIWCLLGIWLIVLIAGPTISQEIAQLTAIVSFFSWQAMLSYLMYSKSKSSMQEVVES